MSTNVHVTSIVPKEMKAYGLWIMKKLKAFSKQALELIHNQSHLLYTQDWLLSYDTELYNPLKRTKERHIQSKDTRIPYWFCLCFNFVCVSASQVTLLVKNPPANAGGVGLIFGQEDLLDKEIVTNSNFLAWEIPWTEEPGRLLSMGLQRVGHS